MTLPSAFISAPIAHRGYHDRAAARPENSLGAFRAAIVAGYGIELDVQPSSDGRAMVFHDDDLMRLTGRDGPVTTLTTSELGALPILDSAERVPTLRQVLELVAGRVPLLIEVKDQDPPLGPGVGALEAEVVRDLAGYSGPVALMSFNPHSVAALARLAPEIPRGLTTCAYDDAHWHRLSPQRRRALRAIPDYGPTGSVFVSHEATDLSNPRLADLKSHGAAILCWTIRSPEAEAAARAFADNVTFEGYPAPIAP